MLPAAGRAWLQNGTETGLCGHGGEAEGLGCDLDASGKLQPLTEMPEIYYKNQ